MTTNNHIVISYVIQNKASDPLYIFVPNPPYLCISEQGEITVACLWFAVPDDVDAEFPDQPSTFLLDPLQSKQQTLSIEIPIVPSQPYTVVDVTRPPWIIQSKSIQFAVGYVPSSRVRGPATTYCRGQSVQSIDASITEQHIVYSNKLPLQVACKVRSIARPLPPATSNPLLTVKIVKISQAE